MAEESVLSDVRAAKQWVDQQFQTFQELGDHLRATGQAYRDRTGPFASLPKERPEWVQKMINEAEDEPGKAFLDDVRAGRSK